MTSLEDFIKFIGCMALTALLLAPVVLATLSFALNWDALAKLVCSLIALFVYFFAVGLFNEEISGN